MEQSCKKQEISRPKPLRLYGVKGVSGIICKAKSDQGPQASQSRESAEKFHTPQLKSGIHYTSIEKKLACLCSLEKLINLGDDENAHLRDQLLAEREIRMRSSSISPFFYYNPEGAQEDGTKPCRHSFPLMNNTVSAPERPLNPMVRDTAFIFDADKTCKNSMIKEELSMQSNDTPCQNFYKESQATCVPN